MANRVTLTKAELLLPAGRELVALCTSITEDGIVSDEEVGQLRNWVHEHQGAPVKPSPSSPVFSDKEAAHQLTS